MTIAHCDEYEEAAVKTYMVTAELIPEESGGYTVYCPELDIHTQGETEEECLANLQEATELHIETVGEEALRAVTRRQLEVHVGA